MNFVWHDLSPCSFTLNWVYCTLHYHHLHLSHDKMSDLNCVSYYLIKYCRFLLCHSVSLPQGCSLVPALVTDTVYLHSELALHRGRTSIRFVSAASSSLCFVALLLASLGGACLLNCLWLCFGCQSLLFSLSLLQNHGPFILTQLLLKPGWAEW